jgi:thiamine biosynthesis protein ThiS
MNNIENTHVLMKIILNGHPKEIPDSPDLGTLIDRFRRAQSPIIVELNGEIIKDRLWYQTVLRDGDVLELVHFVGGGDSSSMTRFP